MSIVDPTVEALLQQVDSLRPDQLSVLQRKLLRKQPQTDTPELTEEDVNDDSPAAAMYADLLASALKAEATDIHIEPRSNDVTIRLRVDGLLRDAGTLALDELPVLLGRIKHLCALPTDEQYAPQLGRCTVEIDGQPHGLRITTLPTTYGEKTTIHLQKQSEQIPDFEKLGLQGNNLAALNNAAAEPHGLILIAGPKDAGVTTTAYSIMTTLLNPSLNIATLENPIERQLTGISQTQTNPRVGLTFASGLRAILRQDPNIIYLSELRSQVVADLVTRAALGGQLVIAGMPAANAAQSITHIVELGGLEPYLAAACVKALVAQRLVRLLCEDCKQAYTPQQPELDDIACLLKVTESWQSLAAQARASGEQPTLWHASEEGCQTCNRTGYKGRVGIFEVMPIDSDMQQLIVGMADPHSLRSHAIERGMQTLQTDGLIKALQGRTSIEELLRATRDA